MRTHLGTIGTVARRAGDAAVGLAGKVQREVTVRWSSSRRTPPPVVVVEPPPAAPAPAAVEAETTMSPGATPSPADVARAVARNDANLRRVNGSTPKAKRRSVPGAKLPARAGQGIIGV